MSTKSHKSHHRIRFYISTLISLALASLLIWGLVPIYEPEAELYKLNLRNVNENYSTVYIQMDVINRNYFRGFNYTANGWVELFYLSNNESWEMTYSYIPEEYHDFRKTLHWNFTMNITARKLRWPIDSPLLKSQQSHIYVSLYLSYYYKILLWTTKTNYYQWLDMNAYLNKNFDFEGVSSFNRTKDLTLAIST